MATEFEFERGKLLENLVLLEDHADEFNCPYCMEKHLSALAGYATEIAKGNEGDQEELLTFADDMRAIRSDVVKFKGKNIPAESYAAYLPIFRNYRRLLQGAGEHSHAKGMKLELSPKKHDHSHKHAHSGTDAEISRLIAAKPSAADKNGERLLMTLIVPEPKAHHVEKMLGQSGHTELAAKGEWEGKHEKNRVFEVEFHNGEKAKEIERLLKIFNDEKLKEDVLYFRFSPVSESSLENEKGVIHHVQI